MILRWHQEKRVPIFFLGLLCLVMVMSCERNDVAKKWLAELDQRYREAEGRARGGTLIGRISVTAPIGRFLLVRKGADFCALRFTTIYRGGDARPPSWWQTGGESEYAEIDWYYQGDGSGDFTKPTVESGHGQLYEKPAVGLGRLNFPRGRNVILCGPFRLRWDYPSYVQFHLTNRKEDDVGNELAPTKWAEISDVNVGDPRLKWYRYDENRERTYIQVDHLW